MPSFISTQPNATSAVTVKDLGTGRRTTIARCVLLLLLITNVPLFLHMPLIDDAAVMDLEAQLILRGGVLYRDIFETNLPGPVWFHAAIRWLFGPSSVALRAADLAVFALILLFLRDLLKAVGMPPWLLTWVAVVAFLFYFSLSEWCHCQRDIWLLAPALGALCLRWRQVERLRGSDSPVGRVAAQAALEGLVWGVGVWIKPMVVVPAFASWLASIWLVRRAKPVFLDLAGLVAGGLIAGAAGLAWLWMSGAWPHFWETMLDWNPDYVAAGRKLWSGRAFLSMAVHWFPWFLLFVPAGLIAVWTVVRHLGGWRGESCQAAVREPASGTLLSAFFLGWLFQAFGLQQVVAYVYTPGVLLSVAVCVGAVRQRGRRLGAALAMVFLLIALVRSPALRWERLVCWWPCLEQGSTADIRERLKLHTMPDWRELERVADYLRNQGLRHGELACFGNSQIHLYLELGLQPPTRYVYLQNWLAFFPDREGVFRDALAKSPQKYVVTDLMAAGMTARDLQGLPAAETTFVLARGTPKTEGVYPWSLPVVFRAGRYAVHRVDRPIGRLQWEIPKRQQRSPLEVARGPR